MDSFFEQFAFRPAEAGEKKKNVAKRGEEKRDRPAAERDDAKRQRTEPELAPPSSRSLTAVEAPRRRAEDDTQGGTPPPSPPSSAPQPPPRAVAAAAATLARAPSRDDAPHDAAVRRLAELALIRSFRARTRASVDDFHEVTTMRVMIRACHTIATTTSMRSQRCVS